MVWYPNVTVARSQQDAQLRTLYACFGASLVLHGLAMFAFPGLRSVDQPVDPRILTAMFASRPELAKPTAPVRAPTRAPERQVAEPQVPRAQPADPAPVPIPRAEDTPPVPAPGPKANSPSSVASISPDPAPAEAPARVPEALDASLLESYRLALIDAAKRYKRYPVQAMERGWEGRVEIRVVVDANGMIKSALVKSSSRYQILDDQALDMVKRALARTPVPPALLGREFSVDIPVIFELQSG